MIRKAISAILLGALASLLVAVPVWAYVYRATYTISENGTASYTMLPVLVASNNQWMADNGFMSASANDTRIETLGGLEKPHLVTDNMTLTAVPVAASSQTNLYFSSGNTPLASMPIITGYGGYVTVADDPALELGSNFTIEQKGYVDTSAGSDKNLVYKQDAFRTYVSGSGNITSVIGSNFTEVDPNNKLTVSASKAEGSDVDRDENVYLYKDKGVNYFNALDIDFEIYIASTSLADCFAGMGIANTVGTMISFAATDVSFLAGGIAGADYHFHFIRGNIVAYDTFVGAANTLYYCTMERAAGNDSVSVKIYSDSGRTGLLDTVSVAGFGTTKWQYVYGFVNRNDATSGKDFDGYIQNLSLFRETGITATGISSGEHTVKTTADGANMTLSVTNYAGVHQGNSPQSVDITGISVPNTADNWTLLQNNVMPYMEYMTLSVNATAQLLYQPTAMISGTTLPDRAGTAQNGTITWGSNPAGVAVALGGLVSSSQPLPGLGAISPTQEILPTVEVTDWFVEPDVSGTLLTNPLRPFVTLLSDNSQLTEIQSWRLLALALILMITVATASAVRGHYALTGIAAGASVGGAVVLTIFPLWTLVFAIICVIGGVILERSPVL